ncbi:type 4 pilus major pilin [Methylotenera sp.]|uniref:type 4 pilus major pilin n=1 Tax=Methylotenera sp. TaxID=2051956 RepID=UPI0025E9E528|nr:type 4 pilus major pilin [Methylotenera sp.]
MEKFKHGVGSMKNQAGFTLVETGIVVAIVLLLLAGVVGAPRIIAGMKANNEIGELKTITTGVQKIYSNDPTFAGATLTEVISLRGLPDERITSATTAANRWGGAITLAPATVNTANDSILLTTTNVPEYECVNVIPQAESGFIRIAVNGADVKAAGAALNKTTLGTQCVDGANSIGYYFTK